MISRRAFLSSLCLAPFALKAGVARAFTTKVKPTVAGITQYHCSGLTLGKTAHLDKNGVLLNGYLGPVVTRTFNNMEWVETGKDSRGNGIGCFAFNDVDDTVTPYLHGPKTLMWPGEQSVMRRNADGTGLVYLSAALQLPDGVLIGVVNVDCQIHVPRYDIAGTMDAARKGQFTPVPTPTVTLIYQEQLYS